MSTMIAVVISWFPWMVPLPRRRWTCLVCHWKNSLKIQPLRLRDKLCNGVWSRPRHSLYSEKMDDLRRYYSFYRDVYCIWGLLTIKCHYWAQDKLACVCVENPGQLVHAAGANNGGFHYSSAKIRIWTLGMLIYYFTSRNYILPILITDWTLERSDNLLSVALCSWLNITLVFTYPPHSPLSKFGIVCRFSMCSDISKISFFSTTGQKIY